MTFEGVVHEGDFVFYRDKQGYVLSIGVRTTRLKWFSKITVIRNKDFKDYVNYEANQENRVSTVVTIIQRRAVDHEKRR